MTALIQRELFQLFIMFYCGLALMLIFEVRDTVMRRLGVKSRASIFIYFGSWLCAAFLFCQFLYKGSHGVITIYGIFSLCAGILLWKKVIYGIIIDRGNNYEEEEKRETSGIRTEQYTEQSGRISRRKKKKHKKEKKNQNK